MDEKMAIIREPIRHLDGFAGFSDFNIIAGKISIIRRKDSFKYMDAMVRLMQAKLNQDKEAEEKENAFLDSLEIDRTRNTGKGFGIDGATANFWMNWKRNPANCNWLKTDHFSIIKQDVGIKAAKPEKVNIESK